MGHPDSVGLHPTQAELGWGTRVLVGLHPTQAELGWGTRILWGYIPPKRSLDGAPGLVARKREADSSPFDFAQVRNGKQEGSYFHSQSLEVVVPEGSTSYSKAAQALLRRASLAEVVRRKSMPR